MSNNILHNNACLLENTPQRATYTSLEGRKTMGGKPVFSVPSKSILNFSSRFGSKLLCTDIKGNGTTFSSGTACVYSCAFCYVPAVGLMSKQKDLYSTVQGKHEDIVIRRENAVEVVHNQLDRLSSAKRNDGRIIYASHLVDVAANMILARETIEICKEILSFTNWHIRLLSKSNLLPVVAKGLPEDEKGRMIYGVSTGTLDDNLAKAFERGTPLVSKRIESLHWLQDNGYRTFGMICPSLPQTNYQKFAEEMRDTIRYELCEHVWAEVLNARGESFTRTFEALKSGGFDDIAEQFEAVSSDNAAWETYARNTFLAHTNCCEPEKLRFLQYVTKKTRQWWEERKILGAVVL